MKARTQGDGETSWGHRLEEWSKRNGILVVITLASVLVSSIITLANTGADVVGWFGRATTDWRDAEYSKLRSLEAGYTLEKFQEKLGAPLFRVARPKKKLTDLSFRGRGYWVEATVDEHNVVVSFAVTSCRADFNPTFTFPNGEGNGGSVVLNRSSFPDVLSRSSDKEAGLHEFISGATANSYAFQFLGGINPTNYQEFAWGINDACTGYGTNGKKQTWEDWYRYFLDKRLNGKYLPSFTPAPRQLQVLSGSRVNTYAETAAATYELAGLYPDQIGIDRINTRTVPEKREPEDGGP